MIWYTKNDQKRSWLKMSDQIFLILVYARYTKKTSKWHVIRFILYHWYVQHQRLQEMTIFDCYTWGILFLLLKPKTSFFTQKSKSKTTYLPKENICQVQFEISTPCGLSIDSTSLTLRITMLIHQHLHVIYSQMYSAFVVNYIISI